MRDVVLYQLLSLDGVAEEPGDWMFDGDQAIFDNLARIIERQDDVLLGRGTYDYWASYWPTSDVEPFATFINTTTKHVFATHPLSPAWENTVVVDQPPPATSASSSARAVVTSASTGASRSRSRCSPPTSSTSCG